jgi:hypothetical protein
MIVFRSGEHFIARFSLRNKIKSHIVDHKINMEIAKSKASLTNLEIKEIVEKLQNIPKMYPDQYYRGSGSYNDVRKRFEDNNRIIKEVLEILKK